MKEIGKNNSKMKKGKLITFEGPDCSGKDTQLKKFETFLKNQGESFTTLREPGTTEIGKKLRNYLLHDEKFSLNPVQEAIFFNAARIALLFEEVIPALDKGHVLMNRYFHSTLAYQSRAHLIASQQNPKYKSPVSEETARTIETMTLETVENCTPDITFIFNIPFKTFLERKGKNLDKFESRKKEYIEGVIKSYSQIVRELPNCFLIDGTNSPDKIHEQVVEKYFQAN